MFKKIWERDKKIIKFILVSFVIWQSIIILIETLSPIFVPPRSDRLNLYNDGKVVKNPPFLWKRANFDGGHYLSIARNGYGLHQQAFFPMFPILIKKLTPLFSGMDLVVGLLISNISFLIAMYLFYKLVEIDFKEKIPQKAIIFLLFFPVSFFFGMVYTEGLFLMLIIGSFFFARKKKWLFAGIFAGFASATRIVGIFIFPALLYELYKERETYSKKELIINIFFASFSVIGILLYMHFLWKNYQDPFMFFNVQPYFGAGRSNAKIILLYQVFYRYFKMIAGTKLDPLYFTVWLEFLSAVIFLAITALSIKKIRFSYMIFSIASFLAPTITGTFSSLPRYLLVQFPLFIYLATIKNQLVRKTILIIFSLLFIFSLTLYFRGYWIS